jgi:hypothetical protein
VNWVDGSSYGDTGMGRMLGDSLGFRTKDSGVNLGERGFLRLGMPPHRRNR